MNTASAYLAACQAALRRAGLEVDGPALRCPGERNRAVDGEVFADLVDLVHQVFPGEDAASLIAGLQQSREHPPAQA